MYLLFKSSIGLYTLDLLSIGYYLLIKCLERIFRSIQTFFGFHIFVIFAKQEKSEGSLNHVFTYVISTLGCRTEWSGFPKIFRNLQNSEIRRIQDEEPLMDNIPQNEVSCYSDAINTLLRSTA